MSPFDRARTTSCWRSIVTMALSRVVSEIFNVEKSHDLEIRVRGHSRSSKVVPFDRLYRFLLVFYSNCVRKTCRVTLKPGLWVTQGHHRSIRHYDFLLMIQCNHGPISDRFLDRRRFQSQNFPNPSILRPLNGFPLKLGTGAGVKKTRMMVLSCRLRSLTISSAVWIECTNVTDRQTDRQTDTVPQQRPRLPIASRSKNPN